MPQRPLSDRADPRTVNPGAIDDPKLVKLTKRKVTFRQWRRELGDAVPLQMVPPIARLSPQKVLDLIKQGLLPVHKFTGVDGRVFRYVRMADIGSIGKPEKKLTWEGMVRAFRQIANQP